MSAKPEIVESAPAPAKRKKILIIVGVLVLVLVLAGVGAYLFISKRNAAAAAEEGDGSTAAHSTAHDKPKVPPVYLPLDSMVVNLADPGGERVAQVGITFEVLDAKASDTVKSYLPTIRSSILLLISQKTAEELLKPEGKTQLAADILRKVAVPFGGEPVEAAEAESPEIKKKKTSKPKDAAEYPVVGVLFSSFIVQ